MLSPGCRELLGLDALVSGKLLCAQDDDPGQVLGEKTQLPFLADGMGRAGCTAGCSTEQQHHWNPALPRLPSLAGDPLLVFSSHL